MGGLLLASLTAVSHGAPVFVDADRPLGALELQRLESEALIVPGRYRLARLDRNALNHSLHNAEPLILNPFADLELRAEVKNVKEVAGGSTFISGSLDDGGHFTLFLHASGVVRGELHSLDGTYTMKSAQDDFDHLVIEQHDLSGVPLCGVDHGDATSPEVEPFVPWAETPRATEATREAVGPHAKGTSSLPLSDGPPDSDTVDVLVVYTQRAEDHEGGPVQVSATIENEVAKMNQVLVNSGLPHRQIKLATMEKVDYVQIEDLALDVANLTYTSEDGYDDDDYSPLDDVHGVRAEHGADFVHLFVRDPAGACGRASGKFSLQEQYWIEQYVCSQSADPAACLALERRKKWHRSESFSVSSIKCTGGHTFAHELGHTLGLWHDRADYSWPDYALAEGGVPLRPYAFGYTNPDLTDLCQVTVMGNGGECGLDRRGTFTVPYFSNPDLFFPSPEGQYASSSFEPDTPMGVPGDEYTIDLDGPVDASRAIDDVWEIVASLSDLGSPMASEEPLPPAALVVGGNPTSIDLDPLFFTEDGGELTYTAESSAPAVAAVTIEGATLNVYPKGTGTATVTITATARNGDQAVRALAVTVESGAPMVTENPLPPTELSAGGNSMQFDLAALFAAVDGGGLTYTAESSDRAVATVRIVGTTLHVEPAGVGTTTVTITATARNGARASRNLAVTVRFDHGDSPETATLLAIGPPLPGTIGDSDDVDVFRIDLQGSATLEVRTSGPTDTRGKLLDGLAETLASDDDSGPAGHNFLVRTDLEAGIYYVAVTGEPGDYAVMARLGDAPDHGETEATATLLTLYAAADLGRVSPSALLAAPGRIAPTSADVDVFRFDVPLDATDATVRSAGGTDVYARLLDSSMTEIAADTSEGNFRMEAMLDAGIYYVVVTGSERGAYRVLAWGDSAACACADAHAHDHGGDAESSTLMPIGPPLAGTIGDASDLDVFRIDLQGSATLEVRTSGPTDTRGELLDGTGARILSDDDSGPAGHNFLVRADLEAGIYYVAVTGEPGDYAVMARLGDAPDHGETATLSTLVTLYTEADLDRVSPSALLATPGKIAPTDADTDMFRLDVPENGMDVTIRSAGGTDVFGRLLDSSLDELAADDSDGNFRMEARLDAGSHYVEVGGRETGTYRVLAWGDRGQPCACAADGG